MSGALSLLPSATAVAASANPVTCGGEGQPPIITRSPGYVAPTPPPTVGLDDIVTAATVIQCGETVAGNSADGSAILGNAARDVLYRFTLDVSTTVTISTCGSSFDTFLRLYTRDALVAGRAATAYNDDSSACTGTNLHSLIRHTVNAGTEYVVVVEGYLSNEGAFQLSVTCDGQGETASPTASPATSEHSSTPTDAPASSAPISAPTGAPDDSSTGVVSSVTPSSGVGSTVVTLFTIRLQRPAAVVC